MVPREVLQVLGDPRKEDFAFVKEILKACVVDLRT